MRCGLLSTRVSLTSCYYYCWLTCFSKVIVYCFLVGTRVDSLTTTADQVIRIIVVVVSEKSTDACVLQLRRHLHSNVQLISTQRYHGRDTYGVLHDSLATYIHLTNACKIHLTDIKYAKGLDYAYRLMTKTYACGTYMMQWCHNYSPNT